MKIEFEKSTTNMRILGVGFSDDYKNYYRINPDHKKAIGVLLFFWFLSISW